MHMHKTVAGMGLGLGLMVLTGMAVAQIEATSSTYFLDIDPARYNGPPGQRVAVQLDDQPRQLALNAQDEICVQLRRATTDNSIISAHVRVLRPVPHEATEVKVAGPGISPGTFRSTPWGMLLRVVPAKALTLDVVKPMGTSDAPVCSL
jgi:hypothetical protein